jgi:hypothetical protein
MNLNLNLTSPLILMMMTLQLKTRLMDNATAVKYDTAAAAEASKEPANVKKNDIVVKEATTVDEAMLKSDVAAVQKTEKSGKNKKAVAVGEAFVEPMDVNNNEKEKANENDNVEVEHIDNVNDNDDAKDGEEDNEEGEQKVSTNQDKG